MSRSIIPILAVAVSTGCVDRSGVLGAFETQGATGIAGLGPFTDGEPPPKPDGPWAGGAGGPQGTWSVGAAFRSDGLCPPVHHDLAPLLTLVFSPEPVVCNAYAAEMGEHLDLQDTSWVVTVTLPFDNEGVHNLDGAQAHAQLIHPHGGGGGSGGPQSGQLELSRVNSDRVEGEFTNMPALDLDDDWFDVSGKFIAARCEIDEWLFDVDPDPGDGETWNDPMCIPP